MYFNAEGFGLHITGDEETVRVVSRKETGTNAGIVLEHSDFPG